MTREPGAHTYVNGESIAILRVVSDIGPQLPLGEVVVIDGQVFVGTVDASVGLLEVKPAGKKAMPAMDWLRGQRTSVVLG